MIASEHRSYCIPSFLFLKSRRRIGHDHWRASGDTCGRCLWTQRSHFWTIVRSSCYARTDESIHFQHCVSLDEVLVMGRRGFILNSLLCFSICTDQIAISFPCLMTRLTSFKRFGANPLRGISWAVTIRSDPFAKCPILVVLELDQPFANATKIMGTQSHFSMVLMAKRTTLIRFAALLANEVYGNAE
jgi:hypothetical protein